MICLDAQAVRLLLCLCKSRVSVWAGLCLYSVRRPGTETMRKQIPKSDIRRDLYGDKKRTRGGIIIQWAMKESFSFQCDISDPTCNSLVKYSTLMGHVANVYTRKKKTHVILQYKTTQRNACSAWKKKLLWKQFLEMKSYLVVIWHIQLTFQVWLCSLPWISMDELSLWNRL